MHFTSLFNSTDERIHEEIRATFGQPKDLDLSVQMQPVEKDSQEFVQPYVDSPTKKSRKSRSMSRSKLRREQFLKGELGLMESRKPSGSISKHEKQIRRIQDEIFIRMKAELGSRVKRVPKNVGLTTLETKILSAIETNDIQ